MSMDSAHSKPASAILDMVRDYGRYCADGLNESANREFNAISAALSSHVSGGKAKDSETGPCDKCQGGGKLFDRRCGDVECDECHGHGWFNDGIAGPAEAAPHEWVCAVKRGGKCTCSVLDGAAQ